MLRQLSSLQTRLLKVLAAHPNHPLPYRDLAKRVAVSSTNTISYHLQELERKGYLIRDSADPRNYQVVGRPDAGISHLNLYGLVECGPKGSFLDDAAIDKIAIATRLITFPVEQAFLVKAHGDSMEPRICAGDIVLANKQGHADPGQVVVCVNDGEALIKKFVRKKHGALLVSLNPKYDPIVASDDFRIVGLVRNIVMGTISQG